MALQQEIEAIVEARKPNGEEANFNMTRLQTVVWPRIETIPAVRAVLPKLKGLGEKNYKKLSQAILRNVFLIELVKKPKIETTKFRVRWIDELKDDPRGCSFDECMAIASDLLTGLSDWTSARPEHDETLKLCFGESLLPYEAPLDYQARKTAAGRLHERGNIMWLFDPLVLRTLKLRQFLTEPQKSPDSKFFKMVLTEKIRVKTYLTDRVLTGDHKTNREKRWETHPESVHFAERRVCMAIEYALVTQVCRFQGFPQASITQLQAQNVLPASLPTALCPITGDALSYESFRDELLNPAHGRAAFQVGHLNPLKLGDASSASGHRADNISWISADGNRIQGSLSLEDVRLLIQQIAENYTKHGWWPPKQGAN